MSTVDTILSLIKERGITKNKLLTDLSLSKNSFVNWHDRGTSPQGETLSKIADYFNVSTDYLLGRTEQKTAAPSEDETAALLQEPYMKEIYETLLRLTPESRKLVLAQIRAVGDFESSAKKEASPPRKDPTQTP